jgi:hypothetical protein
MTVAATLALPRRPTLGFALAVALLLLPDCCLTGHHSGALMFTPICRALR